MKIRRDPADLRRDAAGALLADLDGRFLADVWIVKAKHRHAGANHIHGRGILRRSFDKIDNALGQISLTTQLIHTALEFFAIRQLVVPKEINNFLVTDFSGQLVNVVAAVNELTFVANDIAQPRGVRDDAFKSAGGHVFPAFILLINVSAIVAGVSATAIPAALSASIFPAAVPFPPETIAPACPIRRPGGAVIPAINAATGFLQLALIHSAASSSAEPPISPIRIIASVFRSSLKRLTASRCDMPLMGSPPIPMQVD